MKRRSVHFVFAALALSSGALAGNYAWHWQQARQLNAAIAMAGQSNAPMDEQPTPESQLARAIALSRNGASDAAIKAYEALVHGKPDEIRQAALYNQGNLYLREALKEGNAGMPLIELSKQSYRTLLRMDSKSWDARVNLEQALRLAPENDEIAALSDESAPPKERAITTMRGNQLLLP